MGRRILCRPNVEPNPCREVIAMSNWLKNLIQHTNPAQPAKPKAIGKADSWDCPRFLRTALAKAVCGMALIAASGMA